MVRGLLVPGEDMAAYSLLAPWVVDDELTLAAALTRIASDDALARDPRSSAGSLQMASLVRPDVTAAELAHRVVSPVVRRVRHGGVPWRRWWDVHGLHCLLVELWAARRCTMAPSGLVRRELRAIWQVSEENMPTILANTVQPFSLLPPDIFETSLTGEATKLLRGLVIAGRIKLDAEGDLHDNLPDLGDRGDLIEVVRRVRLRHDLEHAINTYIHDIGPAEAERLQADLASWDEQLDRFLPGLTSYEIELCCKPSPGILYRDQCLAAGRNYWVYPLLEEDALPALTEPGKPSEPAPRWIQDEIISGGARAFRTNIGPYPVWLLTGETSLSQAAIEAVGKPGQTYGLGHRVDSGRVEIRFRLPVPDGDPGPAQEVPFFYSLSYVNSAWQLLHLAAVGYVRMVILTLAQDDALLTRGSIVISLPGEMRDDLADHALSALRSLVGDDMRALLWRRAVDDPEEISSATFHANEAAKGEELLDEIIREPPPDTEPRLWSAFQEASRALARARARMAAALADSRPEPKLATAAEQAAEHRQRAREMARTSSGALDPQTWKRGLAAALPDDRTAFIHFFFKNDILQTIYLAREGDDPSFSPVRSSSVTMDPLLAAVQKWAAEETSSRDWHQALQVLLAKLTEGVLQPLAEELHARGLTRLIISPTPPLDLLPLHAVQVTLNGVRHALCDAFAEITYMPTMRMLAAISDRPMSASTSPLIVAHSGGYPRFSRIGGPALEAASLHTLYPNARIITEPEATPQTVLAAMTGSRTIHVASHAYPGNRWANGLVLQGDRLSQAILSAADVLSDGDLTGVELVVLNACRTGSHRSAARVVQALRGLEAAFLARGAHAVISTFWDINDLTALVFATLLHASMAQHDAPGKAYRQTIAYMRREGWHEPTCPEGSQHRAETLLDLAKPTWREELDRQVRSNPLSWSGFKITGLILTPKRVQLRRITVFHPRHLAGVDVQTLSRPHGPGVSFPLEFVAVLHFRRPPTGVRPKSAASSLLSIVMPIRTRLPSMSGGSLQGRSAYEEPSYAADAATKPESAGIPTHRTRHNSRSLAWSGAE